MRPKVGLMPNAPTKHAGMRTEPPPSEPVASGTMPAAIAAPDPPLEPPGVRSRFHGFRVTPKTRFFVSPVKPNSGVFVLPTTIAPAAFNRATCVESQGGRKSRNGNEPNVVGSPAT